MCGNNLIDGVLFFQAVIDILVAHEWLEFKRVRFRSRSRTGRRYRLSYQVAMLGSWVQPDLVRNGRLLRLMDTLADDTGATVVLATNVGVRLQCRSEEHTSELQSLMRISYAVFCLTKKNSSNHSLKYTKLHIYGKN